jgi:hypothetical protein
MEAYGLVGGGDVGHVGASERVHVGRVRVRDDGGSRSEGIHVGNDEAVGYVDCDPGYDRVYLDDKDRYTTDCEMITPVYSHPRSGRAGAG